MSPDGFLRRIGSGKVVSCIYRTGELAGLISAWPHDGSSSLGRNVGTETSTTNTPTLVMSVTSSRPPNKCWRSCRRQGIRIAVQPVKSLRSGDAVDRGRKVSKIHVDYASAAVGPYATTVVSVSGNRSSTLRISSSDTDSKRLSSTSMS